MKLYLSSFRFGNRPEELVRLAGRGNRAAVIMNARDHQEAAHRALRRDEEMQKLTELGFAPEELDLRQYFQTGTAAEKLQEFGMVWVAGGNVFLLRTAVQLSGLDTSLVERIRDDLLVYASYSSGSCLLSSTLEPLAIIDDPALVQQTYGVPAVTSGLGILDYVLVPHYMSDHPESKLAGETVSAMEKTQQAHLALIDGEVLIIKGDGRSETVVS